MSKIRKVGKYLQVNEMPPVKGHKTKLWKVFSRDGYELGQIRWFFSFRAYVFHPNDRAVHNAECLRDMAKFLDDVRKDRV